jgi:hypothetical protein
MKLSKCQELVSQSTARFRVLVAGRRMGKSWLAMNEMAKTARLPKKNVWYISPSYRQSKQIIWDELKSQLLNINWIKKINETDLTLILRNGSKISLRGADNPDSLRGVALDFVVFDEFALIDEKAWTEVIRPTLSDRKGSAMFITTPAGTANWAFDLYNKGLAGAENWQSFQFTTLDGGNVPLEEIEQARQDLDDRTFKQEYLATFESYANRVYYAFDRAWNLQPWERPTPTTIYCGIDFNISPMSISIFSMEGEVIHQIDEICINSSNTQEAANELKERYPKTKIFAYPDPACRQRKTSAGTDTDLTILQNNGFIVKCPNSHNPVRDGINAVNSKLRSSTGKTTYFIDPKCKHSIASLEKHSYKEGTSQPDKDDGYDHMADSIRYFIDYVFPVKRDRDPDLYQPSRFGHSIK